jgi:predicted component of type VI protein secretion system
MLQRSTIVLLVVCTTMYLQIGCSSQEKQYPQEVENGLVKAENTTLYFRHYLVQIF